MKDLAFYSLVSLTPCGLGNRLWNNLKVNNKKLKWSNLMSSWASTLCQSSVPFRWFIYLLSLGEKISCYPFKSFFQLVQYFNWDNQTYKVYFHFYLWVSDKGYSNGDPWCFRYYVLKWDKILGQLFTNQNGFFVKIRIIKYLYFYNYI